MRTKISCSLFVLALVLAISTGASAFMQTTYTYDKISFLGDVENEMYYSFDVKDGFPTAPAPVLSWVNGEVMSSSAGGPAFIDMDPIHPRNQVLTGSDMLPGQGLVPSWYEAIHLTFAQPVHAVGFEAVGLTPAGTEMAHVVVRYSHQPTQTFSFQDNDGNVLSNTFWGLTSEEAIAGISVYSTFMGGCHPCDACAPNAIDNLYLTHENPYTPPVPEPGSVAAFAVGFVSLGAFYRKRSR